MEAGKDISYSIVLGDCFHNDTVSLSINKILAFDNVILNSNFSTGLTQTWVSYKLGSNGLVIKTNDIETKKVFEFSKSLKLLVIKNGKLYPFELNLSNGKNILIEGCESKIKANQFKKPMVFM